MTAERVNTAVRRKKMPYDRFVIGHMFRMI